MNWLRLENNNQLTEIIKNSFDTSIKGVLLFKHSTRCSISSMALSRLERNWNFNTTEFPAYYLDLLNYRTISNSIADTFKVEHASPQLLIIKNGECIYNASHSEISVSDVEKLFNS
ncbi:MAG: bacillithiol system redox-active protein YtxJ [Bacteroidia bacterium]|nr:bacillithiol system redox-active protein YtxJ [Bacteroidia bacterium]